MEFLHRWSSYTDGLFHSGFGGGDNRNGFDDPVGIQRNRIDAGLHQKFGKLRIVAGRLATDSDVPAVFVGPFYQDTNRTLDGVVAFVKKVRQLGRVTVHPEGQLCQVV